MQLGKHQKRTVFVHTKETIYACTYCVNSWLYIFVHTRHAEPYEGLRTQCAFSMPFALIAEASEFTSHSPCFTVPSKIQSLLVDELFCYAAAAVLRPSRPTRRFLSRWICAAKSARTQRVYILRSTIFAYRVDGDTSARHTHTLAQTLTHSTMPCQRHTDVRENRPDDGRHPSGKLVRRN